MIDAESPPFDESERVVEISTAQLDSRVKVVQMAGILRDPVAICGYPLSHDGPMLLKKWVLNMDPMNIPQLC
jgi:hypothetical protein